MKDFESFTKARAQMEAMKNMTVDAKMSDLAVVRAMIAAKRRELLFYKDPLDLTVTTLEEKYAEELETESVTIGSNVSVNIVSRAGEYEYPEDRVTTMKFTKPYNPHGPTIVTHAGLSQVFNTDTIAKLYFTGKEYKDCNIAVINPFNSYDQMVRSCVSVDALQRLTVRSIRATEIATDVAHRVGQPVIGAGFSLGGGVLMNHAMIHSQGYNGKEPDTSRLLDRYFPISPAFDLAQVLLHGAPKVIIDQQEKRAAIEMYKAAFPSLDPDNDILKSRVFPVVSPSDEFIPYLADTFAHNDFRSLTLPSGGHSLGMSLFHKKDVEDHIWQYASELSGFSPA